MEKLGSLEQEFPEKKKKNSTNLQTARRVVPTIPANVKLSDFVLDAPVDLEAALRISEKKGKEGNIL